MEEVNFRLKVEADKAVSSVEKVNDSFDKTAENVEKAEKQTKDLNKATKKSPGAIKKVSTAFKGLGTAIKAAGIGLLIGAVTKVVDFMGNFREVTVEVEKAFAGLNVVLGRAVEAAIALATMDFDRLMKSFEGVEEEIDNVTEAVEKQFEAEDDLFELRQKTIKQNAQLEVDRAKQLKIVEDTTLSSEKRIAAAERLEEINKILLQNQKDEIALQKEVLKQQLASEDNEDRKRQLRLEIAGLTAQQTRLEGEAAEIERKASRQRRMIAEQDAKELKDKQDKAKEDREKTIEEERKEQQALLDIFNEFKDKRFKALEDEAQRKKELEELLNEEEEFPDTIDGRRQEALAELQIERDKQIQKAIDLEASEKQLAQIKKKFADEKNDIIEKANQAEKKQEELLTVQKIQMAIDTIGSITSILGSESKAAKGVAIAQALINTYQGISAGVALGFPAAIPAIAAATATGFGAVKNIVATNPTQASAGQAAQNQTRGAQAQAAEQAQAPDFNIVGDAGSNEIAGAIGNRNSRPQKSYVVSKEMTTQAELDRNIEEEASLG